MYPNNNNFIQFLLPKPSNDSPQDQQCSDRLYHTDLQSACVALFAIVCAVAPPSPLETALSIIHHGAHPDIDTPAHRLIIAHSTFLLLFSLSTV